MYKLMFHDKVTEYATRNERDEAYDKLNTCTFDWRALHKWDPEHDNTVNPYKGIVAKHGNCWY